MNINNFFLEVKNIVNCVNYGNSILKVILGFVPWRSSFLSAQFFRFTEDCLCSGPVNFCLWNYCFFFLFVLSVNAFCCWTIEIGLVFYVHLKNLYTKLRVKHEGYRKNYHYFPSNFKRLNLVNWFHSETIRTIIQRFWLST